VLTLELKLNLVIVLQRKTIGCTGDRAIVFSQRLLQTPFVLNWSQPRYWFVTPITNQSTSEDSSLIKGMGFSKNLKRNSLCPWIDACIMNDDIEAGIRHAEPPSTRDTSSGLREAFVSTVLYVTAIQIIYEYYVTFNSFGLVLRALQWVCLYEQIN